MNTPALNPHSGMLCPLLLALTLFSLPLGAQPRLRVIRAGSATVDIRDGAKLYKSAWRIAPEQKPDIYKTSSKRVTFYTDQDSLSVTVDPKTAYDFVILLNGKDSALTRIQYEPSRLELLRQGAAYDYSDRRSVPAFRYQLPGDSNLKRIRSELRLDSVAGTGSELSQIFNLMHWVHDLIRHDGSSDNPELKNAIDLIRVCQSGKRGVNCRMLATILNECYLAMNIRSRYVTCMPREAEFEDCHVINMVYSRELNKWIWIDPTFDAYVMDEKGELLGIREVRERLISGRPLVLNADANWNRESLQTAGNYLQTYMAKNLYHIQAPVVSEYNTETWEKGKAVSYIELLPLRAEQQAPQKQSFTSSDYGVDFTYYKTNNPDLFWTKPE